MSNQRIEIIIQEINYWKEHKVLPDMYCDFLLALYTKGENETETSTNSKVGNLGLMSILQFTTQFFLLLLSVVVINMQHTSILFQLIFLPLSFLGTFWLFRTLSKKRDIYFHLSTAILLVHFFLLTIFFSNQYISFEWIINIIIMSNFSCWFIIGYKFQLRYLQIIGIILMIFTMIYIFL